MKKILLVCNAGMSTSMLVLKMEKAAEAKGIEVEVKPLTDDEKKLISDWNEAKRNKDFVKADELRKQISDRKIEL